MPIPFHFRWRVLAWLALAPCGLAHAQTLDNSWTIVAGSAPLEQRAALDLKQILAREKGVTLRGPQNDAPPNSAIYIGTPQTNAAIKSENARAPFRLNASEPESYHDVARGGNIFIVGQSPKGAMNGAFRFIDHDEAKVAGLDDSGVPAFGLRVANHKMNQSPPPNWSEDEQARYYARHFINVIWGEKYDPPLSYEARQKYGLGAMLEVKFPPGGGEKLNDPALVNDVYFAKKGEKKRALDPFDAPGRAAYQSYMRAVLAGNPDVKAFYAIFGDYSTIPDEKSVRVSDGAPYPHSRAETMKQILSLLREVTHQAGKDDIVVAAWMWHAFFGQDAAERKFMEEMTADGYGLFYNEAGNSDNWLVRRDNFNKSTLETDAQGNSRWGAGFLPLVSAGGACESVNPVIAMPLPLVAGHKILQLAQSKAPNVVLWWGSAESWTYDANLETIAEQFWQPNAFADLRYKEGAKGYATPDPLLQKIARRDFGAAAPAVQEFWNRFDAALITTAPLYQAATLEGQGSPPDENGLHFYDWWQRMGIFTEPVFGAKYMIPLTATSVGKLKDLGNTRYWGTSDYALANYAIVLQRMKAANAIIIGVANRADLTPQQRERARQTMLWSELYQHLLTSQFNSMRALAAMQKQMPAQGVFAGNAEAEKHREATQIAAQSIVNSAELKAVLTPIIGDEIANDEALIALVPQFAPNFNITDSMGTVVRGEGSGAKEITILNDKIAAMKDYLGQPLEAKTVAVADEVAPTKSDAKSDAMERKVLKKLGAFTDWLKRNKVRGMIGEVGWPGDRPAAEQAKWDALGATWYDAAARENLWVVYWATGEAWGGGYALNPYSRTGDEGDLETVHPQAQIIEAQKTPMLRGINSAGAEFYAEHFDSSASYQFLKNRGISWIRLTFSWDRVQPELMGPLDEPTLARLLDAVRRARSAGLQVSLDCHNYMRRRNAATGQEEIATTAQLADLWSKLAPIWAKDDGVFYDIMNEPHDLPGDGAAWEKTSQTVLNAIRAAGAKNLVFIPGYGWSGADLWPQRHPKAWISDPANNFIYEAHNYWDSNGTGSYKNSYDFEDGFAAAKGY